MSLTFTKHAVDALNAATSCARQLGHDHIGSEHIFLSILAIPQCQAARRLETLGLSLDDLAESMRAMVSGGADSTMQRGQLPITARTRKIIEMAGVEAGAGNPVGTAHLVLAMLRDGDNAASQLLFNAGVTVDKFISAGTQGSAPDTDTAQEADGEAQQDDEGSDGEGEQGSSSGANGKAQKT
ncbi:MAG: hypothetical protein J6T51_04660, partial [Kiritimatiellae bacterium]|nr:hypothetical protein [Kiritimatiellia bacterium]